jgi:DNA-binding response OmpR family regulator
VLDVGLPDGNGLDALPELRRNIHCSIVMMTAWGQLPLIVKGLQHGADCYLVKPVPMAELSAVLMTLLRRVVTVAGRRADAASHMRIAPNGSSTRLTYSEWSFAHSAWPRLCLGRTLNLKKSEQGPQFSRAV